jgi:hypothetical protein
VAACYVRLTDQEAQSSRTVDRKRQIMLTAHKKALILTSAGVDVPAFPTNHGLHSQSPASCESSTSAAVREANKEETLWNQAIELLYVEYAAARAAKSLREAEEIRQLDILRRANARQLTKR